MPMLKSRKNCLSTFWAFFFLLSSVAFVDGATNVTVDNLDDRIVFFAPPSKKWTVLTGRDNAIDGTVTVTYTAGLYFYFQFEGTAIYIVASTFKGAASFTPSVDGVIIADNIAGGNTSNHLAPFWGVGGLSAGTNHTLNVTIGLNPNVTVKSNFELDALIYTTDDDVSDTITSTMTSPSSSILWAGSSTIGPAANTELPTSRKVSNVAPIVGGIVGGVVVLVICLVTSMCLRNWSSNRHNHQIVEEESVPRPFVHSPTAPIVSQELEKVPNSRPTSAPAGSTDRSLSSRILVEMGEIRAEIARLRDGGVGDPRTESVAPPDYDTLSQAHL